MPVAMSGAITFDATKPRTGTGSSAMLATSVKNASAANVAGPRRQSRIPSPNHARARSAGTLRNSRLAKGGLRGFAEVRGAHLRVVQQRFGVARLRGFAG